MILPDDLKYAATHEWIRQEGDEIVVGISDIAQDMLGDLVFVGDVHIGADLKAGDTAGVVESVKAASDIYAPVSGTVTAFNEALAAEPQQLNQTPYDAWIFKLKPHNADDLAKLLTVDAYRASAGL